MKKNRAYIQLPNLSLAESCFDVFAKLGMSCSLNLKSLTISFH